MKKLSRSKAQIANKTAPKSEERIKAQQPKSTPKPQNRKPKSFATASTEEKIICCKLTEAQQTVFDRTTKWYILLRRTGVFMIWR